MLRAGDDFPEFDLSDQDGRLVRRSDLLGKRTIVYFYPKNDTPGCTAEACGFRDALPRFDGARVYGVSPDNAKSHLKFRQKYGLNFTLLADPDRKLIEPLGLWVEKTLYGKKYMGVSRTTFLLDANGKVERIWEKVKPEGHEKEVLAAMASKT